MSIKIMGAVWDMDLPHNERMVLLAMADHADHEGGSIFPSVGLVAWKCGYSTRAIQLIRDKLVARKILVEVSAEPGSVKHYRIDMAAAPMKAPYRPLKKFHPCKNVTPETAGLGGGVKQLVQGRGETAIAPEPSVEPSIKPSIKNPAPSAQRPERGPVILDGEGDPKALAEPVAETPPSRHKAFVDLWAQSYQAHVGQPYPFAGGRDGKAVKLLTSNCRTPEQLVELAEWCWSNLQGFVGQQCLTIHGFQSQQAVVQGMRAQREGRMNKPTLTESQRAANVAAGSGWKNDEF